jgi:hypothetical protein
VAASKTPRRIQQERQAKAVKRLQRMEHVT